MLLSAIAVKSYSQKDGDRIVAIVGNEAILESDLNNQLYLFTQKFKITEMTQGIVQEVLNQMINDKVIQAKAEQDSIYISDDEVRKQVDFRLQTLVQQFGSEKNIENTYGMTLTKIRSIIRVDIKKQMMIERMKQMKFGSGFSVSRAEVEIFFNEYKDSIPNIPETYELLQISKTPPLPDEAKKIAKDKAQIILDSLKSGKDFSELARRNSDDSGSAIQGGDLGKMKKGVLVKEFEDAAYLLEPGEVSNLIETIFGYHIIKLIEKSGDLIHTQHILVKFPHLESADFDAINLLKDIKSKSLNNEKKFKELAVEFSSDNNALLDSGYVGRVAINSLDSIQISSIKELNTGEITNPMRIGEQMEYTYSIYFLKAKFPEHKPELEGDFKELERMAIRIKEQKEVFKWIEELKKSIYVEVKI